MSNAMKSLVFFVLMWGTTQAAAQNDPSWISSDFGGWSPEYNIAPQLSGNARFVLYTGQAELGIQHVVVDRMNGMSELVSVNSADEPMNQPTFPSMLQNPVLSGGSISDDGRFVVFDSTSTNLVSGTTDRRPRVYLRDRVLGSTALVADQPGGYAAIPHGDNRLEYIIYVSSGSTPETSDVWLYVRSTGMNRKLLTHRVADLSGPPQTHVISGNGRYLVFGSAANGWVPEDQNGDHDVFRMDLETQEVVWVSVDGDGTVSGGPNFHGHISDDGERVSFLSGGAGWLPNGAVTGPNGFVKDLRTGGLELANAFDGRPQGYRINDLVISGDGSTVAFRGYGATPFENGLYHVYRRHMNEPRTHVVDLNSAGDGGNGDCHVAALTSPIFTNWRQFNPSLSQDGRQVAFSCYASNLLPGVDGMHVYVRSYAGTPNSALPIPSQGAWGLSLLVAGVAGLALWPERGGGRAAWIERPLHRPAAAYTGRP